MAIEKFPEITVSKLDAARTQFETAITLWFHDGDPVSIHTLTAAAHQICNRLVDKDGKKSPMIFNESLAAPGEFEAFRKFVVSIENFSKHAKKDPAGKLTFPPMVTPFYLIDGLELFHSLGQPFTALMLIFRLRMGYMFPGLFSASSAEKINKRLDVELGNLSKLDFLNICLQKFQGIT